MLKVKRHYRLPFSIQAKTRAGIRSEVFNKWIEEEPGDLNATQCYRYDVERLIDGSLVYLTRPTRLNKGVDFRIFCEGFVKYKNGNDKPPSHQDLFAEMEILVGQSLCKKREIVRAVKDVWCCESSDSVIAGLKLFHNDVRAQRVVLLMKWFFIEQDVTYWVESGRHMLLFHFENHFKLDEFS